jgi:hypothetical protein
MRNGLGRVACLIAVIAVVASLACLRSTASAETDAAKEHATASAATSSPAAGRGRFAGRIAIRGDRKIYLECRGSGRPTVLLEAGTGDLGEIWSEPPAGPGRFAGRVAFHPGVRIRPPGHLSAPRCGEPQ